MSAAIMVRAVRGPDLSRVVNLGTYLSDLGFLVIRFFGWDRGASAKFGNATGGIVATFPFVSARWRGVNGQHWAVSTGNDWRD